MRRRTFGLAVAAAAGFGLSACSDGGGGGGEDLAMPEDTEISASLNYGIWDDVQAPAMEEIIAAFNEECPNIEVNITIAPFDQYFTRLQTQAGSGELPDVFWMNGPDRKSTRLNSSHVSTSYAVFCLKKKNHIT